MHSRNSRLLGVGLVLISGSAIAEWTWTPETGRLVNLDRMPKETPELQVEFARGLLVGKKYEKAFNETDKFIKFYPDTDWSDDNQKLRGDIRLADGEYTKAADEYQLVITGYPDSPLYNSVIQQQYVVGNTLYSEGQKRVEKVDNASSWNIYRKLRFNKYRPLKKAIEVYTMVIDNQPFTDTASEAQYKVGLCHFTRGEYLESAFEYRRVLEDYGQSEWVQEALFSLIQAYDHASRPAEYDQAPSQLTIDTINQYKRQYPSDTRIAEMDEVVDKLNSRIAEQHLFTAKHYEKRGHKLAARMSYERVVEEYANTLAAEDAQKWLAKNPPQNTALPIFLRSTAAKG
jgi:outer membrane protein assembly factor BamD (BamD/ComL family)